MLDSLITSKTRLRFLIKFFVNKNNHSHLRGLAEEFGESTNAIRKGPNNLTEAGFMTKQAKKSKIEYKANMLHPYYTNIQDIIGKYIGFDKLLETVIETMGEVNEVVLTGDYAQVIDSVTIEILIKGDEVNEDYLDHLGNRIGQLMGRKVRFNINGKSNAEDELVLYKK